MTFIKHTLLFIRSNLKTLQRKWFSLPLLLLFPIILISLVTVVAISIFMPEDTEPIHVGLVDLDQSKETQTVVGLIEESSQLGSVIHIEEMTKTQAEKQISTQLSAFVTFPEGFTKSLYNGNSVTLHITGNPGKQTESYLVKEVLDSIARHIRASQANILTVNVYAKQLSIDNETRQDILLQQFNDFLIYAVGKDKMMDEKQITNQASTSPVQYYGLAGWFMMVTIWLFIFYSFFTTEAQARMQNRMRLYGVTIRQQLTAKIVTAFVLTCILAGMAIYTYVTLMDMALYGEDYGRITVITGLYSFTYLVILAILETIITGQKGRLLAQSMFTLIVLLASGAIIPTLYFPLYVQDLLPYVFASEAFHWLQEILLENRLYADYIPMALILMAVLLLLIGTTVWKERTIP
ncbi:ABC transporter permease [Lentibacillus salinarum]|uniref:ABC transporter permease n=1 Tax=Lentibacillus salinarum TaxID=446820 RepID=A0ABW3ZVY3_9BACI